MIRLHSTDTGGTGAYLVQEETRHPFGRSTPLDAKIHLHGGRTIVVHRRTGQLVDPGSHGVGELRLRGIGVVNVAAQDQIWRAPVLPGRWLSAPDAAEQGGEAVERSPERRPMLQIGGPAQPLGLSCDPSAPHPLRRGALPRLQLVEGSAAATGSEVPKSRWS